MFILLTNSRSYTVFRLVFPPPVSPRSKGPRFQDKVQQKESMLKFHVAIVKIEK